MAVNNAVQMALCIECSPAVQEVGFDSRPKTPPPPTLYAEDVGGPGQAPTMTWLLSKCSTVVKF